MELVIKGTLSQNEIQENIFKSGERMERNLVGKFLRSVKKRK